MLQKQSKLSSFKVSKQDQMPKTLIVGKQATNWIVNICNKKNSFFFFFLITHCLISQKKYYLNHKTGTDVEKNKLEVLEDLISLLNKDESLIISRFFSAGLLSLFTVETKCLHYFWRSINFETKMWPSSITIIFSVWKASFVKTGLSKNFLNLIVFSVIFPTASLPLNRTQQESKK